jgi:hypothetical protein
MDRNTNVHLDLITTSVIEKESIAIFKIQQFQSIILYLTQVQTLEQTKTIKPWFPTNMLYYVKQHQILNGNSNYHTFRNVICDAKTS